jgi:hypothetical protein
MIFVKKQGKEFIILNNSVPEKPFKLLESACDWLTTLYCVEFVDRSWEVYTSALFQAMLRHKPMLIEEISKYQKNKRGDWEKVEQSFHTVLKQYNKEV